MKIGPPFFQAIGPCTPMPPGRSYNQGQKGWGQELMTLAADGRRGNWTHYLWRAEEGDGTIGMGVPRTQGQAHPVQCSPPQLNHPHHPWHSLINAGSPDGTGTALVRCQTSMVEGTTVHCLIAPDQHWDWVSRWSTEYPLPLSAMLKTHGEACLGTKTLVLC